MAPWVCLKTLQRPRTCCMGRNLPISQLSAIININLNLEWRSNMASKDKAGKEERKKPKLSIKEKRKVKDDKKKTTSVTNTGA